MQYNFEHERSIFIKAIKEMLETEKDYNVIVYVGEKPDFKEFHVHSNILRIRSEYFDEMFSAGNVEKDGEKFIIRKPNITPQAFDVILEYLYSGNISIISGKTNKTGIELLNIIIASDELMLNDLSKYAKDFVMENNHLLRNDPVEILQIVHDHKTLANIQEFCLKWICSEPEILFNSDKFTQLSSNLLEIILKRDDLNLDEIEIWKNLIKWGLAQDQIMNKEVTEWDQRDVETFKKVLDKFIPLIRFYDISSKDYLIIIKPYEGILSKELKEDLYSYYMIPGHKPRFNDFTPRSVKSIVDSVIINRHHIARFANWIDKKDESTKYIETIPYEFNLLYRASRDGSTMKTFNKKCDNKGATIIVVKIKDSKMIVGGYNPHDRNVPDSFKFQFYGYKSANTGEITRQCSYDVGRIFCKTNFNVYRESLSLYGNWSSAPYSYNNQSICDVGDYDDYDDYEVFHVIKKSTVKKGGFWKSLCCIN